MDRERLKLGANRYVAARGHVFALSAGSGFQMEAAAGRTANVVAEGEVGSPAVDPVDAPRFDLKMVDEVSAERGAT